MLKLAAPSLLARPLFPHKRRRSWDVARLGNCRAWDLLQTSSSILAYKYSSDGCICNRSPSYISHERNETDTENSWFRQGKDLGIWEVTSPWLSLLLREREVHYPICDP